MYQQKKATDFMADLLSESKRAELVETILLDTAIKAMKDIDEALDNILKEMSANT